MPLNLKGKRKPEANIPVVSMSDIAFLLIIFFLVSTQFMNEGGIKYELPRAVSVAPITKDQVSVVVDVDGKTYMDGAPMTNLKQVIEQRLQNRTKPEDRVVMLKCDKNVPHEKYLPVIQEINSADAMIKIVTDEGRGDKALDMPSQPAAPKAAPPQEVKK